MDYFIALAADPTVWAALAALTLMEIVLGIDNLVFISIISNKLPEEQRQSARMMGIAGALVLRLALLGTVAIIVRLTDPVFSLLGQAFSWRDMILIAGGLFLVWKATKEIHELLEPEPAAETSATAAATVTVAGVIGQILVLDIVFSIDSIVTAVGMTDHIPVMFVAVIIAVIVMALSAKPLGDFIHANPSVVMLALGFLLLIGTTLIADGFGAHLPKGYVYAAMGFAVLIEGLNLMSRRAVRNKT